MPILGKVHPDYKHAGRRSREILREYERSFLTPNDQQEPRERLSALETKVTGKVTLLFNIGADTPSKVHIIEHDGTCKTAVKDTPAPSQEIHMCVRFARDTDSVGYRVSHPRQPII